MSWRKHFKAASFGGSMSPISGSNGASPKYSNWESRLPEIYVGHPNRVERYGQYEQMDADSEINAALDILAEFSSQQNTSNNTAFEVVFKDKPTDNEIKIIKEQLVEWNTINEFNKRMFKIVRNVFKYGDQVFIRDPETFKLLWTEMGKVTKVIVNESNGKEPEQYFIKDIGPNLMNLTATAITASDTYTANPQTTGGGSYIQPNQPYTGGGRFTQQHNEMPIDAEHIVHCSLTEGLDSFWPFGNSVLEHIFKVYKQKELLEDAIIIYRIQRAPERRIFKIDVGNMVPHMAMAFVERVKNEIHQRRIPSQTGGGSSTMDATYSPMCLDLSTKIPLLDGRELMLSELIAEFNNGKENWAYSCDPVTGEVVPGPISWAGITRQNAETIELTLDNGETFICTSDHKIPVLGKGFVEAKDLTENDSLIAFNTRNHPITTGTKNKNKLYKQVYNHSDNKWKYVHRVIGEFFRKQDKHNQFVFKETNIDSPKVVIHHKDFNRFNNSPDNLVYMGKVDHVQYHSESAKNFWNALPLEESQKLRANASKKTKEVWNSLDTVTQNIRREKLSDVRQLALEAIKTRNADPVAAEKYAVNQRKHRKEYFAENLGALDNLRANAISRLKTNKLFGFKNQSLTVTREMLSRVATIVKQEKNKHRAIELFDKDEYLLNLVRQENQQLLNSSVQCKIDFDKFGYSKLKRLLKAYGFLGWKDFVSKVNDYNHKVVSIKKVENRDVGTLTIDGIEQYHNHHTFAISAGIFVKNSTNEDFFFPTTADGRGSTVETLAGGTQLGEITDLRFFTNKLFRGLRIPSSYLPTEADEGTQPFNNGNTTTALIQEWRFNQYCKRLQSRIASTLDHEFKMFMRWRGITIDNGLFEIKFPEPQNFAKHRQAELDSTAIQSFTQLETTPYLSKRFMLKRYLCLTEEEMQENEEMWNEEQATEAADTESQGADLRSVGVTPGGISSDMGNIEDLSAEEVAPGPGEGPEAAAGAAPGGPVPPPPPPA